MEKKPLISVIMATFNEKPEYIRESILSILNQTYRNLELIILDDSTNESTIREIDSLASSDNRIRLIRKEKRMGFVPALNEGLRLAKGDFIARMDGDDISLSDRFEKQIQFLEGNPNTDILGGGMNIIDAAGTLKSKRSYPEAGKKLKRWAMFRNPLAHPTVMFRREILEEGNFYNEEQKMAEDLEFWLRLLRKGYNIKNLPCPIINYRVIGDLGAKRSTQWKYNRKARLSNFTWRMPFFSVVSVMASSIYCVLPQSLISRVYKKENNA